MTAFNSNGTPWARVSRLHKIIAAVLAILLLVTWWLGRNGSLGCPVGTATGAASSAASSPAQAASALSSNTASNTTPNPTPSTTASSLDWVWADGKLVVSGEVRDEASRQALLGAAVKRLADPAKLVDRLQVSPTALDWPFAARFSEIAAWGSDGSGLKIRDRRVTLSGTVPLEQERRQRGEAAALYFGPDYVIDNQIVVQAPDKPGPVSLYFETGKTQVPGDAKDLLARIVAYGNASPNSKIQLSGFHDKRGNPLANQELAKNRALAVREFLSAAGLAQDRVILVPPAELVGAADDQQARRVDVTIAQ